MNKIGEMEVRVSRVDLLDKLVANRATHATIVKEAREGYVKAARKALEARLLQVIDGKIVNLYFNLSVPVDNSKEYDTVIGMLGMSQDDTIRLSASEYRCLVEDNWDWKSQFLMSNAAYSDIATQMLDN